MTFSIKKLFLLILSLAITTPTYTQIENENEDVIIELLHNNRRAQYNQEKKQVTLHRYPPLFRSIIFGGLSSISAFLSMCAVCASMEAAIEKDFAASAGCLCFAGISAIPVWLLIKYLSKFSSDSDEPYITVDHQGIFCSDWKGSRKKIHWHEIKKTSTFTQVDGYGSISSQYFMFKLKNGSTYRIYPTYFPISFNDFCDIVEYFRSLGKSQQ